jgi:DNA-binding IclR family transcriptional regulator
MQTVRAVDRAIDILQAVSRQPDGIKIADLERQTGIARPTLYRLVRTLARRQLLRPCSDPTQYALDIGIVALAQPWMRSIDLLSRAEDALVSLAAQVGETVAVCLHHGTIRVYAREIVSRHPLKYSRGVGVTDSLIRGAGGLAILAFEDEKFISDQLASVDAGERRRLRSEIAAVRQRGFAVSEGQIMDGATAIAAPLFGSANRVVGSVGIYGPSTRLKRGKIPEISAALLACVGQINIGES